MGLVDELDLVVFVGAALDDGPDCEDVGDQVFFIAIGVHSLFVLLLDFGCEF